MRKALIPESAYRIRKDALWREVDGEIVLLDTAKSVYFGISGAGAFIWKHLHYKVTARQILEKLKQEYEADEDTLKKDALTFLKQLVKSNIIEKVK